MTGALERFLAWARENHWHVEAAEPGMAVLPEEVALRHPVPDGYLPFFSSVGTCLNPGQTKWLMCAGDYAPKPGDEFRWDEFERISLDAAQGHAAWEGSIRRFWDSHFPFFMSVDGGYGYYAIDLADGSVVKGDEPEFEETTYVSGSFDEFLSMIASGELDL
ncbi:MAG: SMI1/KNR4 family protein [Methanomassiliicoccaceae archaeon]|nr:SMI1/KNR4 family protein [Methanomassiliicoccaceae archaeon]